MIKDFESFINEGKQYADGYYINFKTNRISGYFRGTSDSKFMYLDLFINKKMVNMNPKFNRFSFDINEFTKLVDNFETKKVNRKEAINLAWTHLIDKFLADYNDIYKDKITLKDLI